MSEYWLDPEHWINMSEEETDAESVEDNDYAF